MVANDHIVLGWVPEDNISQLDFTADLVLGNDIAADCIDFRNVSHQSDDFLRSSNHLEEVGNYQCHNQEVEYQLDHIEQEGSDVTYRDFAIVVEDCSIVYNTCHATIHREGSDEGHESLVP